MTIHTCGSASQKQICIFSIFVQVQKVEKWILPALSPYKNTYAGLFLNVWSIQDFFEKWTNTIQILNQKGRVYIDMTNNVLYTLRDSKIVFTYAIMIY